MKLLPSEVARTVQSIYGYRDDPEAAHSAEDQLYTIVLTAVARGECENPTACAQQALMTQGIGFPWWRA